MVSRDPWQKWLLCSQFMYIGSNWHWVPLAIAFRARSTTQLRGFYIRKTCLMAPPMHRMHTKVKSSTKCNEPKVVSVTAVPQPFKYIRWKMCEGTGCWDHSWHTVNYTRIYTQQSRAQITVRMPDCNLCNWLCVESPWCRFWVQCCRIQLHRRAFMAAVHSLCIWPRERNAMGQLCFGEGFMVRKLSGNGKTWEWELANGNQSSSLTEWQVSGSILSTHSFNWW